MSLTKSSQELWDLKVEVLAIRVVSEDNFQDQGLCELGSKLRLIDPNFGNITEVVRETHKYLEDRGFRKKES